MLHASLDNRPWFRARSFGYGAGLPIVWQGWALLLGHMALIAGITVALRGQPLLATTLAVAAALAPLPLYHARTEGGWQWRWGKRD